MTYYNCETRKPNNYIDCIRELDPESGLAKLLLKRKTVVNSAKQLLELMSPTEECIALFRANGKLWRCQFHGALTFIPIRSGGELREEPGINWTTLVSTDIDTLWSGYKRRYPNSEYTYRDFIEQVNFDAEFDLCRIPVHICDGRI